MPDVMKIGSVTGWLRAAALAGAHGLPMSSHLFSEVLAHLMCVTPTAHMLELLDVAGAINATPGTIKHGFALPHDGPGSGINWREDAISRYSA